MLKQISSARDVRTLSCNQDKNPSESKAAKDMQYWKRLVKASPVLLAHRRGFIGSHDVDEAFHASRDAEQCKLVPLIACGQYPQAVDCLLYQFPCSLPEKSNFSNPVILLS